MRATSVGLVAAMMWAASTGLSAQNTMQFFACLVDSSGAPVSTLGPDDLRIAEGGVEGKIVKIEPIDWPVKVQILIDNGTGMEQALVQIRNGVRGLVEALPEGLEVSLITTAPQPRNIVRPTTDRQMLIQGVDRITPDSGAARFVESLNEAAARVDKDKGNHFPVVVAVGSTTAEGSTVMERDVQRMLQRFTERAATVHVVMLSTGAVSGRGVAGANQTAVGDAVAKSTGGRYDNIAAATRLATLLPEIGAQIAKSHARQSHQFRITFQRPNGASGALGEVGAATKPGLTPVLTINGRMP
ncbi:MAG TPA: VWA domain-containing protein [Vicinamibacterales bacterium]|nr:VWA domain-containing protein [Vicinamibacterales bacterium]